jgi:small subunit ribosomal protein S15e
MEEVQKKSRSIKKFTFKGKEIETLLALTNEQLVELFPARIRRRF